MGYDPNEPRDKEGKWTTGASGHNAGGGNRSLAKHIADQHKIEKAWSKAADIVNKTPNNKNSSYDSDPEHRKSYLDHLRKKFSQKDVAEIDRLQREAEKARLIGNHEKAKKADRAWSSIILDDRNAQFKRDGY